MAWLEHAPSNDFKVAFRFGDRKYKRSLKTSNPQLAEKARQRVEQNLRLVEQGRLDVPAGADLAQARHLLANIDTRHAVGLRDRAIIAILIYTAARIGAVSQIRRKDFYDNGDQFCLRFTEKGGKSREIPVRHDLQGFIHEYLAAGLADGTGPETPLFRTAVGRTKQLTSNGMTATDMGRMVKRRMCDAGLPPRLSPHSFRVATITNLLSQGVPLEDVQNLAGHADPRTTRLYDRRQRKVTRNIVERISI